MSTLHLKRPQSNHSEAIPLLERALSIRMKKLGGSHPDTISSQNNLESVQKKVRAQHLARLVGKPRAHRALRESLPPLKNTAPCHCRCEGEIEAAGCVTGHKNTR